MEASYLLIFVYYFDFCNHLKVGAALVETIGNVVTLMNSKEVDLI